MINKAKFFASYYQAFKYMPQAYVTRLDGIINNIELDSVAYSLPEVAYILATVYHETGWPIKDRFAPIIEARSDASAEHLYGHTTQIGKRLGNALKGDGAKYKGRGYVQLTGRANYQKMSNLLNIDLINNPDDAMIPDVAYRILSEGMSKGLFTGVSLSHFCTDTECSPDARRVINGKDKAALIHSYYDKFLVCLS